MIDPQELIAVTEVLKERFNNLSSKELIALGVKILDALAKERSSSARTSE